MHYLLIGTGRDIYPKIKRAGHRLSLLCTMRTLASLSNHGLYERVVGMSADATPEDWAAQARLVAAQDPVDVMGGFNEVTQHIAAAVAQALGYRYHSPATIRRTRDKYAMRQALRAAGVDPTASARVASAEQIEQFADQHGYPVVLKPVDGRGSLGISVVRSAAGVAAALATYADVAGDHEMLVEELLEGEEVSVEAFSESGVHRVVCVTQKFKDPDTSIETGHALPAAVPDGQLAGIGAVVGSVLSAVGLEDGPSHTELFLTADGPRVVETHARLAGDSIVELIALASGVDLDELWIRQVGRESVLDEVPRTFTRAASIAYASPRAVGTLTAIEGLEAAAAATGVVRAEPLKEVGEAIEPAYDSFSRGAFAIATGDTVTEAAARARAAVGELGFVVTCRG